MSIFEFISNIAEDVSSWAVEHEKTRQTEIQAKSEEAQKQYEAQIEAIREQGQQTRFLTFLGLISSGILLYLTLRRR